MIIPKENIQSKIVTMISFNLWQKQKANYTIKSIIVIKWKLEASIKKSTLLTASYHNLKVRLETIELLLS